MKQKTKKASRKLMAIAATLTLAISFMTASSAAFAQTTTAQTGAAQTVADSIEPADVENLQAMAGDSQVRLTWDGATDNVGVIGYKLYSGTHSVQTTEDRYDLPVTPVQNALSYTVSDLVNGQTYYFSVTALDAAGNESPDYSSEASATPGSGLRLSSIEDDGVPPQVVSVNAEDLVTVKVVFSEPIRLPEEHPSSAFQIEKMPDRSRLEVQNAELDSRDATGATVLLTTAPQTAAAEYVLTAGIELQDYYNNPIISGTSDTGSFRGSAAQRTRTASAPASQEGSSSAQSASAAQTPSAAAQTADSTAPILTSASADFENRISLTFSKRIRLPQNSNEQFVIRKRGTQQRLNVLNVSTSVDGRTAYVTTAPQEPVEYDVLAGGVTDEAGNVISSQSNSAVVTGRGTSLRDLVAPEEVLRLVARVKDAQRNIVELRWQPSPNTARDLADQLLSQGTGRRNVAFGTSTSLGTSTTSAEVHDLQPGNWHTFRIATRDSSNNVSAGATASIFLSQTGPGAVAAGLTSLIMGWYSRRRKKF